MYGRVFLLNGLSLILCERNASPVLSDSPTYLSTRTVYYAVKYFECYLKVSHRRHVCSTKWHTHCPVSLWPVPHVVFLVIAIRLRYTTER